jgi:apolipoprotein N-acyltransferase
MPPKPMMKLKNNYWFLSLATGVLMWLAWPPFFTAPIVFIGFLPLFILQQQVQQHKEKNLIFWFYTFVAMLVWNLLTTWWVYYASPAAVAAFVLNAALMTLPWLGFHFTRKVYGDKLAFPAFVFYWLAFEYLHLNWQISWPWLTLGNVFASLPNMVQWYEYTGFLGGTLWVLVVNILVFKLITNYTKTAAVNLSLTILLPLIGSYIILNTLDTNQNPKDAVQVSVIQPNMDPYTDKFGGKTPQEQLQIMLQLAEESLTPQTRVVIFPETSLTQQIDEDAINNDLAVQQLRSFCRKHKVSVLTGADTYYIFKQGEKLTSTVRKQGDVYYDSYNTALLIDSTENIQVYHKSKLVPGVESLPYPALFKPIEKLFDLGGTSGSLGIQDDAEVFTTQDSLRLAPIICYESVYGHWVSSYVRQKADLLCIITNDGWWRDTPGYRQHLLYARLRAIEMRRNIARSANTGISAFINYKGEIEAKTKWWVPAQLNKTIYLRKELTWYARNGDYIGKIGAWLGIFIFLSTIVKRITRKGY